MTVRDLRDLRLRHPRDRRKLLVEDPGLPRREHAVGQGDLGRYEVGRGLLELRDLIVSIRHTNSYQPVERLGRATSTRALAHAGAEPVA